jgi:hypothetical protein
MKLSPRMWSVLALSLFGTQLEAQVIPVAGSTLGCFFQAPAVTCTPTATATDLFLTFTQGTFNGFTDQTGFFGLSTPPNSLGTLSLTGGTASYSGRFLLQVLFTLPTVPAPGAVFSASVFGNVVNNASTGVYVLFDNAPQGVPFQAPGFSGTLDVNVYSIGMNTNETVPIEGFIHTSIAPEPGTTALVATGLMGLIPMARIKRRKRDDA